MKESKLSTLARPAHGTRVEKAVPKGVEWGSVRGNQTLAEKHAPPKVIKLPSGKIITKKRPIQVAPFNSKGQRLYLPKE